MSTDPVRISTCCNLRYDLVVGTTLVATGLRKREADERANAIRAAIRRGRTGTALTMQQRVDVSLARSAEEHYGPLIAYLKGGDKLEASIPLATLLAAIDDRGE